MTCRLRRSLLQPSGQLAYCYHCHQLYQQQQHERRTSGLQQSWTNHPPLGGSLAAARHWRAGTPGRKGWWARTSARAMQRFRGLLEGPRFRPLRPSPDGVMETVLYARKRKNNNRCILHEIITINAVACVSVFLWTE